MLTEKQVWKVLSVVFSRRTGICAALSELECYEVMSHEVSRACYKRLSDYRKRHRLLPGSFYFPVEAFDVSADPPRADFCTKQAKRAR